MLHWWSSVQSNKLGFFSIPACAHLPLKILQPDPLRQISVLQLYFLPAEAVFLLMAPAQLHSRC